MKTIGIVGNGAFAQDFLNQTLNPSISCIAWEKCSLHKPEGLIHVGSGRELPQAISFCEKEHIPLIQASTVDSPIPDSLAWIDAPNLNLLIVKFLYMLDKMGSLFTSFENSVLESHQAHKTSPPKAALQIAKDLNIPEQEIISVRSTTEQQKLHIPSEYINKHAMHLVRIKTTNALLELKTLVLGRDSYIEGAFAVSQIWKNLPNGKITLTELINQGLL